MTTPLLQADALTIQYPGADAPSIADVSLALRAGEILGIVGPNGAGKSTLMRALAGIVVPVRGEVRLGSRSLATMSRREVARQLAFVPQDMPGDIPYSVEEVVITGRHPHLSPLALEGRHDYDVVERVMDAMAVTGFRRRRIDTLSGGERQRVFIARALAAEPRILLLDEPAAHLDLGHRVELAGRLGKLAAEHDVAVAVIHHDLNLAADSCPTIALLAGGRLVATGPAATVLTESHIGSAYDWPVVVDENPLTGAPRISPRPSRPK